MQLRVYRASQIATTEKSPGLLPISVATLWRWVRQGKNSFPKPFKLAAGTTVWDAALIDAWIAKQQIGESPKADELWTESNTAKLRAAQPSRTPSAKLPFPELPTTDNPSFWLYSWLRGIARVEAMGAHISNPMRKMSDVLEDTLKRAEDGLLRESRKQMENVVSEGLLLYAFPDTTKLQQPAAK